MRSFWGLIPRNLWKKKKRMLFVGLGIILSVALLIALGVMMDRAKHSFHKQDIEDNGGVYDFFFFTQEKEPLTKLQKDPLVGKTSIGLSLGSYKIPNSKFSLEINGYADNITEFLNFKLLEGKYPQNNNEIALEEWILDALPQKYKVGDKIKLELEGLQKEVQEKEFILSGIFQFKFNKYQQKNRAHAYVKKTYMETLLPSYKIIYKGYLTINSKYSLERGFQLLPLDEAYIPIEFHKNYGSLLSLQTLNLMDNMSRIFTIIASIAAGIIIFNIFNVTVTERTKEFGMLRALGASTGEIKLLVLGEGIILGCIFIPTGILTGVLVAKGAMRLIVGSTASTGILHIPSNEIITSFIVGFATILLGTYSPAKKAASIPPVEAIHSNNNLKLKGKSLKKGLKRKKFIHRKFGFITEMAYLNVNRNRKRFVTTVASLSISIILVLFIGYIIECADTSKGIREKISGDFAISTSTDDLSSALTNKDIEEIQSIKGISKTVKSKEGNSQMQVPKEKISREGYRVLEMQSRETEATMYDFKKERYKFRTETRAYSVEGLDSLKEHILEGKIDKKKMEQSPMLILGQNLNHSNNTTLKVGDKVQISYNEYDSGGRHVGRGSQTFTIAALLKEDYKGVDFSYNNIVIFSDKIAEKYLKQQNYQQLQITLEKDADYEKVKQDIKEKLQNNRGATLLSYREEAKKEKRGNMQFSIILYSIPIAVAIISIINLFNTMTMNLILRSKEIGMLRALGLGMDEVKKMLTQEGIIYAITAVFWGSGIGVFLTYVFYFFFRTSFTDGMTWSFPVESIGTIFIVISLVSILASLNASRKLYDASIVSSIREME